MFFNDEHVWGVLDEGCNSTVCGHEWMETRKAKLKNMGFDVPMQSDEQKAFKGLAGNVRTKGRYRIPFVLEPEGGKKLPGVLETYVVGEPGDPTPLLLSQHAQAALGLVKDMATSTCTLGRDGPILKLHRTKDSGLLCVCLSKGLINMSFKETPTQIRELKAPDNMVCWHHSSHHGPCWTGSADLHCREGLLPSFGRLLQRSISAQLGETLPQLWLGWQGRLCG